MTVLWTRVAVSLLPAWIPLSSRRVAGGEWAWRNRVLARSCDVFRAAVA
jgi:hypothetical protein